MYDFTDSPVYSAAFLLSETGRISKVFAGRLVD
jgi:hypothetical protein